MTTKIKREPISKKIRFEVFKRDLFTCQYCGKKAPDVILEIDHLKPVSKNGKSNILNLITSCFECNRGKGKNLLSDTTIVDKQRKQIEELAIKREQLQMFLSWRDELNEIIIDQLKYACNLFEETTGYEKTETGKKEFKSLIKKHGFENFLQAFDIAVEKYLYFNSDGSISANTIENFGKKLRGILYVRSLPEEQQLVLKEKYNQNYWGNNK